jgi:hypothetical protein
LPGKGSGAIFLRLVFPDVGEADLYTWKTFGRKGRLAAPDLVEVVLAALEKQGIPVTWQKHAWFVSKEAAGIMANTPSRI